MQNFSAEVLLQFYIALYTSKHFAIYCYLSLALFLHYTFGTLFLACASYHTYSDLYL